MGRKSQRQGNARRKSHRKTYSKNIVSADHAWWHPEGKPENLFDVFDLAINNEVTWTPGKSGFGSNYKCNLVKIYKVKPEEMTDEAKQSRFEPMHSDGYDPIAELEKNREAK